MQGELFIWGHGKFIVPYKVKYNGAPIVDVQISRNEFSVMTNQKGQMYSWGNNDSG
jgi:alpha-tubulin suppressor-like RCC1 family protein